jgi:hypothetical protein
MAHPDSLLVAWRFFIRVIGRQFGGLALFAFARVFLFLLLFLGNFTLPFFERIIGLGQKNVSVWGV